MTKGRKPGPKKVSKPQAKRKKPQSNYEYMEETLANASKSTQDLVSKKYAELKKNLETLKKMFIKLADEHISMNIASRKTSVTKKPRRKPAKAKTKTKATVAVKAKPKAKAKTKAKVAVKAKPKAKTKVKVAVKAKPKAKKQVRKAKK